MRHPARNCEIVDITRRAFPRHQDIVLTADMRGSATLDPGDCVIWRDDGTTLWMLRNAQWFRKLTVHFITPKIEV